MYVGFLYRLSPQPQQAGGRAATCKQGLGALGAVASILALGKRSHYPTVLSPGSVPLYCKANANLNENNVL